MRPDVRRTPGTGVASRVRSGVDGFGDSGSNSSEEGRKGGVQHDRQWWDVSAPDERAGAGAGPTFDDTDLWVSRTNPDGMVGGQSWRRCADTEGQEERAFSPGS